MYKQRDEKEIFLITNISNAIDNYCVESSAERHRPHLGASIIGEACDRKLWYIFRWVKLIQHDPRIYRLFSRGKDEEEKIAALLRGIGLDILLLQSETQKQIKVTACQGHFGGSLDGIILLNDRARELGFASDTLAEFKTVGSANKFQNLKYRGVAYTYPNHAIQMYIYGYLCQLEYGLYIAVEKATDEIYMEYIRIDNGMAETYIKRAQRIINSKHPPRRNEGFATREGPCKFCYFYNICADVEKYEKNCRSCIYASPIEDAKWKCSLLSKTIDDDLIKKGCVEWINSI